MSIFIFLFGVLLTDILQNKIMNLPRCIICTTRISIANRVIPAIRKHIVPQETLAGGGVGVGVDEAADLGIVISALEVIEPGLYWVIVAIDPFSGPFSPTKKALLECYFRLRNPHFS